jgi:hypothetical protein
MKFQDRPQTFPFNFFVFTVNGHPYGRPFCTNCLAEKLKELHETTQQIFDYIVVTLVT